MASDGMGKGRAYHAQTHDYCALVAERQKLGNGVATVVGETIRSMQDHADQHEVIIDGEGTAHAVHRDLAAKIRDDLDAAYHRGAVAAIEENFDTIYAAGIEYCWEQIHSEHGDGARPAKTAKPAA